MFSAFVLSLKETLFFAKRLLFAVPAAGLIGIPFRFVFFTLIWCINFALTAIHWVGFLLDEILFRSYRNISVDRPLFIVGLPRSGTTWLQRVLAKDDNFTSLTLWECLFAPSISERYFWHFVGILTKPLQWLIRWFSHKIPFNPLSSMDKVHRLRLNEPEEDFLLLLPLQACFLLVFLCPNSNHYWRLSHFDQAVPAVGRSIILRFYYRCLQKHLYFQHKYLQRQHNSRYRILSKNPSFTPFIDSVKNFFPDATIVACVRNPNQAVPSQLSSVNAVVNFFCGQQKRQQFLDNMLELLQCYFQIIHEQQQNDNIIVVDYAAITTQLYRTVTTIYESGAYPLAPVFVNQLEQLDAQGRYYKSQHHYDLKAFNLSTQILQEYFGQYWPLGSAHSIPIHNTMNKAS